MSPNLPCAYGDDDEFHHPVGGWYLIDRAITYDNWLTWRHALPCLGHLRNRLPVETSDVIIALALKIDSLYQELPGFASLASPPFEVIRWWDPLAQDEWSTGRRCLLRDRVFTRTQVLDAFINGREGHWSVTPEPLEDPLGTVFEFQLATTAPLAGPGSSRDAAAPGARPRRRRNPPRRKSAADPGDPQPAQCSRPPGH